jgi:hypothetical protein
MSICNILNLIGCLCCIWREAILAFGAWLSKLGERTDLLCLHLAALTKGSFFSQLQRESLLVAYVSYFFGNMIQRSTEETEKVARTNNKYVSPNGKMSHCIGQFYSLPGIIFRESRLPTLNI